MTVLATPPVSPTVSPPPAPPPVARRPRMRRPAHEPEPAGAGPPRPDVAATAGDRLPSTRTPVAADDGPSVVDGHPDLRADDVRRRAAATVRAMVEVLAGRRPPAHLAGVARPEVVRYLTASRSTGGGGPVAPARVHVSRPSRHAAEVVAVCRFGDRFRALTVRLDREVRGHTWCATAVRLL